MCYYLGRWWTREEFLRIKEIEASLKQLNMPSRPVKGFDYGDWPIVRPIYGQKEVTISMSQWGFLPANVKTNAAAEKYRKGYKDEKTGKWITGKPSLNAKSENLFINEKGQQSMWAEAALERRCLILASSFIEYRHQYNKNKRTGEIRKTPDTYPYLITIPSHAPFPIAGIWKTWMDVETKEEKIIHAIVTTEANELMAKIHNSAMRMPTILSEDLAYEWLFGNLTKERILEIGHHQWPADQMQAHTISDKFLSCEEPEKEVIYPELLPLAI